MLSALAARPRAAFHPLTLPVANGVTPVHAFWAEDPAVLALGDGAEVTSWVNRGSNGTAATGTTGTVPTLVLDGISGRPALDFDGIDQVLQCVSGNPSLTDVTFVVVAQSDAPASTKGIVSNDNASTGLLLRTVGSTWQVYGDSNQGTGVASGAADVVVLRYQAFVETEWSVNGVFGAGGQAGNNSFAGTFNIGSDRTSSYWDGKCAMVFVFDTSAGSLFAEPWFREWELGLRGHYNTDTVPQPAAGIGRVFNPLAFGSPVWRFWAEDPDWAAPSDGAGLADMRDSGSDGADMDNFSSSAPLYRAAATELNSRPAIDMGSVTTRWMSNTTTTDLTGASTHVIVCAPTSSACGAIVDSTSGSGRRFVRDDAGGNWRFQSAGVNADTSAAVLVDRPNIIVAMFNGSASKFYLNGVPAGTYDAGTQGLVDGVTVGSTYVGSQGFTGLFAFLAVYDSDITDESWFDNLILGLRAHYGVLA